MALWKYEVVVLFDAANAQDKIDETKKEVETLISDFWWKILDRDDIWYMDAVYQIWSSSNPYYYSLYTELEWDSMKEFKRKLGIFWPVVRYKVFKMKDNQKFLKFKEMEKELENIDFSDLSKPWIFNEIKA